MVQNAGLSDLPSSSLTMIPPFATHSNSRLRSMASLSGAMRTETSVDGRRLGALQLSRRRPEYAGIERARLDHPASRRALRRTGDPDYEPPQLSVRERAEKAGIPIVEKPLLGNARPTSLQRKRSTARPGTLHRHSGSVRNVTRSRRGSRGLPMKPPPSQVIASTPGMTDIALSAALNTSHVRCPHHARAG
jgi:hypothetical protein